MMLAGWVAIGVVAAASTSDALPLYIAALAACVASLTSIVGLILSRRIHNEVKTANGITTGLLAERAEGRRIRKDIPADERSTSEQGYVDALDAGGRDIGHTAPGDVMRGNTAPRAQAVATTEPPVPPLTDGRRTEPNGVLREDPPA